MSYGDRLASGGKSASFGTGGSSKSQLTYDLATLTKLEFLLKYVQMDEEHYDRLIAEQERGQA